MTATTNGTGTRSRTAALAAAVAANPITPASPSNGTVATRRPDPAKDLLLSMEKEFAACLPKILPPDLFMRVALTGLRKTPDLLECNRNSLLGAFLECARLGLEPCTELASLVPFKGECTLIIGYQGYVQLMYRSGQVTLVEAEMIYEADEWSYTRGHGGKFFHRPRIELPDAERGKPILAYSYAELTGGSLTKVVFCNRARAEHIKREYARSAKSPWKQDINFIPMWQKTPVRQLQKWAPKSSEMRRALVVDGVTFDEAGQPDVDVDDPTVIDGVVEEVNDTASEAPATAPRAEDEDPWAGLDVAQPGSGVR